jgi:hypothetical protein
MGKDWHCGAYGCNLHRSPDDTCPLNKAKYWWLCGHREPSCDRHEKPGDRCEQGAARFPFYLCSNAWFAQRMIPILQSPAVATIVFRLDSAGFAITGQAYWEVAEHIKRCSIVVQHIPGAPFPLQFMPCYHARGTRGDDLLDASRNALNVPTIGVNTRETDDRFPGLVIHEATHAWHYLHRNACIGYQGAGQQGCVSFEAEWAAYVAGYMYMRQAQPHVPFLRANPPGHVGRVGSPNAIDDPIFFAALNLADAFRAHQQPSVQMIEALKTAILNHPQYGLKKMGYAFPVCQ